MPFDKKEGKNGKKKNGRIKRNEEWKDKGEWLLFWLALRLMGKQKLRVRAVFFGLLLSSAMLHAFCAFGYYFWEQVHGTRRQAVEFGSGQRILITLVAVLVVLVFSCSAVLVQNLFALTFRQKWWSLGRFLALGATGKDLFFMAAVECGILFGTAVPFGWMLAYLAVRLMGIDAKLPFWMAGGIHIWLLALSAWCGLWPVWRAVRMPPHLSRAGYGTAWHTNKQFLQHMHRHGANRMPGTILRRRGSLQDIRKYGKNKAVSHHIPFVVVMSKKYHAASRRHYQKISLTIIAAVLLYVPPSYLIHRNLKADQAGLDEKYGVTYSCFPTDDGELKKAVGECRRLRAAAAPADSMFYVSMQGTASIATELLSCDLLAVLDRAGWQKEKTLQAGCEIYFLEDSCYDAYIKSCAVLKPSFLPDGQCLGVLINRYINRTSYKEDADGFFLETSLLHADAKKSVSDIEIYSGILQKEPDTRPCIHPAGCCEQFPEGIQAGNVALILPLSQLSTVCAGTLTKASALNDAKACEGMEEGGGQPCQGMAVCALFADTDESLFGMLVQSLGEGAAGKLRDNRKAYLSWYDSLHEIHLAMLAVCGALLITSLLNVFGTLLLHCMQRSHGLAILWSLGQTKQALAAALALESLRCLLPALLVGIPVSGILCYYIYRVYRYVWQTGFQMPLGQICLIAGTAMLTALAATVVSWRCMERQDFLQEIRKDAF